MPVNLGLPPGYVSEQAVAAGIARKTGPAHPTLRAVEGVMLNIEPPAPAKIPTCTVNGVQVVELAVLFKPLAHLVTTGHGVHEITRCYFHNGKFAFGVDMARIGGISAVGVEYKTDGGLQLHLEHGYELFIPASHCQATWRLPESV